MKTKLIMMLIFAVSVAQVMAQESGNQEGEKKKESKPIKISGRVQVQHLFDNETAASSDKTNEGFRVRRGRIKIAAQPSEYVKAEIQMEMRDNTPRMLDAEADLMLKSWTLRAGQFKVPVWREELRSSGKLLLVERSIAAEFLAANLLSARHMGVELTGNISKANVAMNFSNGAGEGIREEAGRTKTAAYNGTSYTNNGKMVSGRINVPFSKEFELGVSGALNNLGNKIDTVDTRGAAWMSGLDGEYHLGVGEAKLIFEGGAYVGSFSKKIRGAGKDEGFKAGDLTLVWHNKLPKNDALAGMDGYEFAAGASYLEPNSQIDDDEEYEFRFGPAFLFGSKTRLQVNAELTKPTAKGSKTEFGMRTQLTVNF